MGDYDSDSEKQDQKYSEGAGPQTEAKRNIWLAFQHSQSNDWMLGGEEVNGLHTSQACLLL